MSEPVVPQPPLLSEPDESEEPVYSEEFDEPDDPWRAAGKCYLVDPVTLELRLFKLVDGVWQDSGPGTSSREGDGHRTATPSEAQQEEQRDEAARQELEALEQRTAAANARTAAANAEIARLRARLGETGQE